jgi:hypothetical protein
MAFHPDSLERSKVTFILKTGSETRVDFGTVDKERNFL